MSELNNNTEISAAGTASDSSESGYTTTSAPKRLRVLRTPPHLVPVDRLRFFRCWTPPPQRMKRRRSDSEDSSSCYSYRTESEATESCCSSRSSSPLSWGKEWSLGMACRAIYEEDGRSYEAFIVETFDEEGDCRVKFFGYNNIQKVCINELTPSYGEEARQTQIAQAFAERAGGNGDSEEMQSQPEINVFNTENLNLWRRRDPRINRRLRESGHERLYIRRDPRVNRRQVLQTEVSSPDTPFVIPLPEDVENSMSEDIPLTTPPSSDLSNLLLAWFNSGYYLGLYQANMRSKDNNK